jgi:6-phosphogluconolactonase
MLDKNLWSHISTSNIHRIPAELGAEQAAKMYREIVNSIEYFDIVFLGMGEDGHTASLFPDNEALQDTRSVVPVYNSPKEPAERVSLSIRTIKKAKYRMVLTGGTAKSDVIRRVKKGESLPINCLGDINWFVDKAALTTSM